MWGPCLHEEVVHLFRDAQRPQQERIQVWLWRRYQSKLAQRRETYDAHRYFRDEWRAPVPNRKRDICIAPDTKAPWARAEGAGDRLHAPARSTLYLVSSHGGGLAPRSSGPILLIP